MFKNQSGVAHILILIAAVGLIAFLLVSNTFGFKDRLFNTLFPKPSSHAASPGIIIADGASQTTETKVKVTLTAPWPVASSTASLNKPNTFALIPQALAQTSSNLILEAENMVYEATGGVFNNFSGAIQYYSDSLASNGKAIIFYSNDTAKTTFSNTNNINSLVVRAKGDQCRGAPNMEVRVDGSLIYSTPVSATSWTDYPVTTNINPGTHSITLKFTNDYVWTNGKKRQCDRNLRIDKITLNSTIAPLPSPIPTPTPTPSPTPSPSPTPIPSPSPSPTPIVTPTPTPSPSPISSSSPSPSPSGVYTVSITLAEDSNFTKNVYTMTKDNQCANYEYYDSQTITNCWKSSIITFPAYTYYTFSDPNLGTKTLYAKFVSSDGREAVYSSSIPLVAETFTPLTIVSPAPLTVPSYTIYGDSLTSGWRYFTTGYSLANFADTSHPYAGTNNISWPSFNSGDRGYKLIFSNDYGINTAGYDSISLAVQTTQTGNKFEVFAEDSSYNELSRVPLTNYGGDIPVGSYTVYTIPLADLNASNKVIKTLTIQFVNPTIDRKAIAATLYIDNVSLNGSATVANPLPALSGMIFGREVFDDYERYDCYHEDSTRDRNWKGYLGPGESFTILLPYCTQSQFSGGPGGTGVITQVTGHGGLALKTISPSGIVSQAHLTATDGNYQKLQKCHFILYHLGGHYGVNGLEPGVWKAIITNTGSSTISDVSADIDVEMGYPFIQHWQCPQADWNLVYP